MEQDKKNEISKLSEEFNDKLQVYLPYYYSTHISLSMQLALTIHILLVLHILFYKNSYSINSMRIFITTPR